MEIFFEWNNEKEKRNIKKHKISFKQATFVFEDPKMLSIPDLEHSEKEERWLTIGIIENKFLVVISHTIKFISDENITIRIISARKVTKKEEKQYNTEI